MSLFIKIITILWCATFFTIVKGDASFPEDTYINALQNSHQTETDYNGEFGGYNYTPPPNNQYLPPPTPAPVYGSPAPVYGQPAPVYGPPQPAYYKPISFPYHSRDHLSLLQKLKTKINLFTIDIFKEDPSSDEDGMESKQVETEQDALEKRIEEVYNFAVNAFEKFHENTS